MITINFSKNPSKNLLKRISRGIVFKTKLLIELKIDVYAIALRYRNGKLEKSINR